MSDNAELVKRLRLGASISRDRGINLDFAKIADEAADALSRQPSEEAVLLDWAETHPEDAMREISVWWSTAGRGCRENRFEFRNILRSAMLAAAGKGKT